MRIARGEGVEGYVVAEYVSETVAVEQTASVAIWGSAVIDASSLNVRSTASTSGKLLYKVSRNERVLLRSRSGDWYGIETEDGSGFVLGDYLEVYEVPSGTYKQGSKGDAVKEIQRRLIELGHMTGSADGSFGAATKNAVMAFQRSVGLTADGVVGTGTLNKLFSLNSSGSSSDSSVTYETLEYGDSGDAVKSLQNRLIELGYLATSATGNFGSATKSALIEFQKKAGLTADGRGGSDDAAGAVRRGCAVKECDRFVQHVEAGRQGRRRDRAAEAAHRAGVSYDQRDRHVWRGDQGRL